MIEITSPLTHGTNVSLVKQIHTKHIIEDYKKFNIDVSSYFEGLKKISIYKCNDTGYTFFYPLNLSGDSKFYEHFQEFDWYYMPWKWEHEITKEYLLDGLSILEVGCARGAFLKKINEMFDLENTIGLELNESAAVKNDTWQIKNETIQSFAKSNKEQFDIVCSFQVLEHIADVKSFLEAKIDCLKKDGKLIISVPNNSSFLKDADNTLNRPPHHMGLWEDASLRALQELYPLKLEKIHLEELQEYHMENYVSAVYYSKYPSRILRKVMRKTNKILGVHQSRIKRLESNRKNLIGQTILAVYQKE